MKLIFILLILFNLQLIVLNQNSESLLKGIIISSEVNSNLIKYAFDNRLATQFHSESESYGWIGINFREKNIITRIEWGVSDTNHSTYLLGIFEGANEKNFEDAIPLQMITSNGVLNEMNSIDIQTKKPFQYFRYIGPNGQYCKMNNIKIYGYEASTEEENLYYYTSSNLPLLIMHSSTGKLPNDVKDKFEATFNLINKNKIELDKIKGYCKFKGSTGVSQEKQSFYIEFENSENILDFKSQSKKWTLLGNYGDKTLIRNLLTLEMSKIIGLEYTIDCKPIELMVNGEYEGTYNLCENVEISKNKINIEKMSSEDIEEPKLSGGYLLEINGFAYLENYYINSRRGIPISIREPEMEVEIQKNYIQEKFDEFEFEIFNNEFRKLDNNSFIKLFLLEELIGNSQAYWNTYIYKKRNKDIFYFGPIYDNSCMGFDNDIRAYPVNCRNKYAFNYGLSPGTTDKFINQIIENNEIIEKIKAEWQYLIDNKIKIEDINNYIDEMKDYISESRNLNFIRWDILNKKIAFNPKSYGTYDEEINVLKSFVKNRINWLNNKILNITIKGGIKNVCPRPEKDEEIKSELDYEMEDDEEDEGLNFQFLPDSFRYININVLNLLLFYFLF